MENYKLSERTVYSMLNQPHGILLYIMDLRIVYIFSMARDFFCFREIFSPKSMQA